MIPWKTRLLRLALDTLHYTAAYRALESRWSGVGVIFTLHHVCGPTTRAFAPNRILEVTPGFLDRTIHFVRNLDYDIVTLDEAKKRLVEARFDRKFVCFTLDDGYLDNHANALPVFAKHDAPFTIYVTSGMPDGTAVLWWRHLEEIIDQETEVVFRAPTKELRFTIGSTADKYRAFNEIYWMLREMPHDHQQSAFQQLSEEHSIRCVELCRRTAMTWEMIRELNATGLATIGAHTLNHFSLSKLSPEQAGLEVAQSREIILQRIGVEPRHFAYPYGDRLSASSREFDIIKQLGFDTATTTRKGVLFPEHAQHLHALPRVSLNGDYQAQRYVRLFLSGVPFALRQGFQRLDVS